MSRIVLAVGAAMLAGILLAGLSAQAATERPTTREYTAQSRPRIVVHPRQTYPGPNAKRHCKFWLAKQIWPNGQAVITPQTRCWWQ